jgi:hypothetical protein
MSPWPLAAAVAALAGAAMTTAAEAAVTRPVTSCDDSGPGTLRAVVAMSASGDTVDYSLLQCQQSSISLQTGIAVAQNDLTVVGNPAIAVIGKYDRVFDHTGSGTLTVAGMMIAGGSATGSNVRGGCIASTGRVVVYESRLDNCYAHGTSSFAYGGAVYGRDAVTVKYSTISGSTVKSETDYSGGGGIATAGSALVRYSTISGNQALGPKGLGGGLFVFGSAAMDHSTIEGNQASRLGGALWQNGGSPTSGLTIRSSTLSGNEAPIVGGAHVQNVAHVRIANATIAFNRTLQQAAGDAAGLDVVANPADSYLTLQSTLISNNSTPSGDLDFSGSTGSSGVLTLDPASGANFVRIPGSGPLPPDTLTGQCPRLRPLRDNGGWTATHALGSGSIAIDHGANPFADKQDQRGVAGDAAQFPRVSSMAADIGAFEVNQADVLFSAGFEGCRPVD